MNNYGYMGQNGAAPGRQKGSKTGLGLASMILGIVSLLLFCTCINWITGILAIIFGIIQIVKNKERAFAIAGIVTAGISLVLWVVLYIALSLGFRSSGLDYYDFYRDYYDYYDYYDDYDYYDEYYYYDEGQEFLSNER